MPGPWIAIEFDGPARRARVAGFSRVSREDAAARLRTRWFKSEVFCGSDPAAIGGQVRDWLATLGVEPAEAAEVLRRLAARIEARLTERD